MQKVYCLYRVSTEQQIDGNDIPMQRQACHEFVQQKGWLIEKEFYERGISGFKVSAEDRDAIQDIKAAAVKKAFDVLLVFMFDRLGRRDDETPFIVEWFVRNGVAVWSVKEGEQRFDSHIDKLLNYIQFWQASGESIKTSIRTKTRLEQLTRAGLYTGGGAPFGYKLIHNGRRNRQNREVYDLAIDPDQADVIRMIFHQYADEGMGTHRIANFLTARGIHSAQEDHWHASSVARILKNRMYLGFLQNGNAVSERIPQLQIIDDSLFEKAAVQREAYQQEERSTRRVFQGNHKAMVLLGVAYCGYCGKRLVRGTSGRKRTLPDGTVLSEQRQRYICTVHQSHRNRCGGPAGYSAGPLEETVISLVSEMLWSLQSSSVLCSLQNTLANHGEQLRTRENESCEKLSAYERDLDDLHIEILNSMRGSSQLSLNTLQSCVESVKTRQAKEQEMIQRIAEEKREIDRMYDLLKKTANASSDYLELLHSERERDIIDLLRLLVRHITVFSTSAVQIEYTFFPTPICK